MEDSIEAAIEEAIPELADRFDVYGVEITPEQVIEALEDAGLRVEFLEQGSVFDG